jgi:sugar lactone lactonase YvrE
MIKAIEQTKTIEKGDKIMKKYLTTLLVPFLALLGLQGVQRLSNVDVNAMDKTKLEPGKVMQLLVFNAGDSPEGIAFDRKGNLYVGNRKPDGNVRIPEIWRISPDGTETLWATLPPTTNPEAQSLLGLVTDPQGNVYAALNSLDPDTHGVWKIDTGSAVQRLDGSQNILFPNGLAFDARGFLYVTDSFGASVWRMDHSGNWEVWAHGDALRPNLDGIPGLPLPGANGIVFFPPNDLYVSNTGFGLIVRIPINPDETAGTVEVVVADHALFTVDGITIDTRGVIYAVIAGSDITGGSPLVKVDPADPKMIIPIVTLADELDRFDFPLSIVFGQGPRDRSSVYITNGDLPIPTGREGPGPGVIQVGVGAPGFPK